MFKVIKKAVSKELVEFCYTYFLMKREVARILHDTKYIDSSNKDQFGMGWGDWSDETVPNTYVHYSDIAMETLLIKLHPLMELETKTKLYPTYSYTRLYKKGDVLHKHTDRASCIVSTTLNLGGDPWPIFLKPPDEKEVSVLLEPGDMLIYDGVNYEHWREEFTGDHCGQVFLHYNEISKGDKYKYDERPFLGLPPAFRQCVLTETANV
tara:strand:- start:139 stop:765 length:627 start_codon:yes stop_codon:yes gene_type:complete